jgi:adenine phosphoribosyltransferase
MKESKIIRLMESFENIPVVDKGGYKYFVHPLSDGIPVIDPVMASDAADLLIELIPKERDYDLLVTVEAMGIPITSLISLKTGLPYSIIRKRSYGIPGEKCTDQQTGYSKGLLYINTPGKNRKILIVDDVLSTGGTLGSVVKTLEGHGNQCIDSLVFVDKMDEDVRRRFESELGIEIRALIHVDMVDGGCVARLTKEAVRILGVRDGIQ